MSSYAYYKVLECSKESSYEEVKKNYRKLVLRYHPDKTDSSENRTTDKFRQIEEAWQILRDPESRKKYDAECRQAQLEMQSVLVFATITEDEMEATVDDDTLSYQCRCGSYYLANREDLSKRNCSLHIPCQECTFVLIVQTREGYKQQKKGTKNFDAFRGKLQRRISRLYSIVSNLYCTLEKMSGERRFLISNFHYRLVAKPDFDCEIKLP